MATYYVHLDELAQVWINNVLKEVDSIQFNGAIVWTRQTITLPYTLFDGPAEVGVNKIFTMPPSLANRQCLIRITGEFGMWEFLYFPNTTTNGCIVWEGGTDGLPFYQTYFTISCGSDSFTITSCTVQGGSSYPTVETNDPYDVWLVEKVEVVA